MNRREFIVGSVVVATAGRGLPALSADEKTTDGGLAPVDWAARRKRELPVLPPGAHSPARFASKCVGCGLCAAACPSHCLRPSTDPKRLGRVELDFRHGWCKPGCTACGAVCPTGAIENVRDSKRHHHVGYAVWERARCIRTTEGVECHACEKHCPVRAVKLIGGFPVVDRAACVGCGACEHYCPARPLTAIHVAGVERHREIAPMGEADLMDEMKRLVGEGRSAVVARGGVIEQTFDGRGLKPIQDAVAADADVFRDAVVADKVVGIGAAKIYVAGKARKVWGHVMSEGAKKILGEAGIGAECETLVPQLECEKKMAGGAAK